MLRTDVIRPISALLEDWVRRGDRVALSDPGGRVRYADLVGHIRSWQALLAAKGAGEGRRVAVFLPNGVPFVAAALGAAATGAVAVLVFAGSTSAELAHICTDAEPSIVVTDPERRRIVEEALAQAGATCELILADAGGAQAGGGVPGAFPPHDALDRPAFMLYTSGTTGRPKGVLLTPRSLLWVAAASWIPLLPLGAEDLLLIPAPLTHSYPFDLTLAALAVGASVHLEPRFSPERVLRLLAGEPVTVFAGVPTMFHYLEARRPEGFRPARLRAAVTAGATLSPALRDRAEALLGCPLVDAYGATETATVIAMTWPGGDIPPGSCGLAIPGVAVRLVGTDGATDVPAGEEGEVLVRGPGLMHGYYGRPEETAEALAGGWYHTGDLARQDPNGFLSITGRRKDIIIRGGQNVAPAEIEGAALEHPDVLDAAAVGVPDEALGEVPVLFVVPRPGGFDREGLARHLAGRLSAYKVPQAVEEVEAIPKTASGKILRWRLRELFRERHPSSG